MQKKICCAIETAESDSAVKLNGVVDTMHEVRFSGVIDFPESDKFRLTHILEPLYKQMFYP